MGYNLALAATLKNIGQVHLALKLDDQAKGYFEQSLSLSKKIKYKLGIAGSLLGLAQLNLNNRKTNDALDLAEEAHQLFVKIDNIQESMQSAKLLSEIYELDHKPSMALKYYKTYTSLKESLNIEENHRATLRQEIQFEFDKKTLSEKIKHEKQRSKERVSRLQERYGILLGVALILLLIGLYLRSRYLKNVHEQEQLLQEIKHLKQKGGLAKLVVSPENTSVLKLDKEKIEAAIDGKLNETDWKILNVIFEDPISSNKVIAEQVALSMEGASSSLRKMYRLFNLGDAKNKKLALVVEATRISGE